MSGDRDGQLKIIAAMLASGLATDVEPFPETEKEFADILTQLRQLEPGDLKSKLVIGGFVDHPYGPEKQRCMECMYFSYIADGATCRSWRCRSNPNGGAGSGESSG